MEWQHRQVYGLQSWYASTEDVSCLITTQGPDFPFVLLVWRRDTRDNLENKGFPSLQAAKVAAEAAQLWRLTQWQRLVGENV